MNVELKMYLKYLEETDEKVRVNHIQLLNETDKLNGKIQTYT
jgi:hypothetical protein